MNWAWRDEPPPPLIAAFEHDADGRLWVFVHIARPTWREGWAAVPPGLPEAPGRLMAVEKL